MAAKRKPILLVSSAVYGFEELLDRIYTELVGFDYEVWMSHKGTMPVYPDLTALDSCRRAVQECNLFLGIILPRYGSGVEAEGADSITHEELKWAIHLKKPRWILAHDHVVFARSFLDKLGYDTQEKRHALKLKPSAVFQDLRAIDMYDLASRHDVQLYQDRTGNWVQKFGSPEEAQLFAVSQFRRFQEAERFVQDSFAKPEAIERAVQEKGGAE
jgi:hypothetical protein